MNFSYNGRLVSRLLQNFLKLLLIMVESASIIIFSMQVTMFTGEQG